MPVTTVGFMGCVPLAANTILTLKIKKMELNAQNVMNVFNDCMFQYEHMDNGNLKEEHKNRLKVSEGVRLKVGFDSDKLIKHREDIQSMLSELPSAFHQSTGGGYSFLNACVTKDGTQWGEHQNVEELMCLGLATDLVSFPLPKDMWSILPGGMPYFTVKS